MRIWIEVKKAEDIDIDEEFNECFCDFYGQTGHDDDNDEDNNQEPQSNEVLVDAKVLKAYEYGAFESHGLKPLRKLIQAYVSACHMADAEDQDEDGKGRIIINNSKRYLIESSTVFDKLMVTCLSKVHEEFHYHLLGDGATIAGQEDSDDEEDGEEN